MNGRPNWKKTRELEKFNRFFVDRELRMIELKKEIAELQKKSGGGNQRKTQ